RIVEVVEKPADPPSNLALTGVFAFSTSIFHACHLVQPSERGEYELADAIDLLLKSGRTVDAVELEGWRVNVNTPEDVERV
ncbi:MAG: sugar phosphate nucleotidyltransferase, partial [Halobacteria archaeon]|nr:sugar phosphate nucleotidyltransferase [Halobacteria archaeon]